MGRRGVNSSFKLFLPVFATSSGGGEGIRGLCSPPPLQSVSLTAHRKTEKERKLSDRKRGEEVGEEITLTTERKHGSL